MVYKPWLTILGKRQPDKRMRDEELALRFFALHLQGVKSYRTPQKHWLNDAALAGKAYSEDEIAELRTVWEKAIEVSLVWFAPKECFRRTLAGKARAINRALFDLTMSSAATVSPKKAKGVRARVRTAYKKLLKNDEFVDLVSRAVDHTKRTKRRFQMWEQYIGRILA